jgi:hypothetical protein
MNPKKRREDEERVREKKKEKVCDGGDIFTQLPYQPNDRSVYTYEE